MKKSLPKITFLILLLSVGISTTAQTDEVNHKFRDTLDNALDLSNFLMNLHGVLPIVMPITEPAVGFGAAVAAVYFLPSVDKEGDRKNPDVIALAGGYTENKTWFTGAGYMGYWKKDHLRYRGILGYGNINLTYYGSILELDYNIQSVFFLQQAVYRIKNSNFFLGGKYQFSKTKNKIFENIELGNQELVSSGVGLITEYENFDNLFSPTKGNKIHLAIDQNLEFIGSDFDFTKATLYGNFYFGKRGAWMPALRVETQMSSATTPFYAKPFVSLRGVPAARYQGDFTILAETEHEFSLSRRWSLIGFTGIGAAYKSFDDMSSEGAVWNAGTGFRYLIARAMGLKMGLDVAKGPEDWGVYVTFGSSWFR